MSQALMNPPGSGEWRRPVSVPASAIIQACETRLAEIARSLRPGVAATGIPETVRARFGPSVLGETIERTVELAVRRLIREGRLPPLGAPVVDKVAYDPVSGLRFDISLGSAVPAARGDAEPVAGLEPEGSEPQGDPPEAGVPIEGPEPGAASLLQDVLPSEAVVGEPGRLAPGWWQEVPPGLDWRVSGTGRDYGVPYVELQYRGIVPAAAQISIRFASTDAARGVTRLWLEVPWRVAAGRLPETCSALLVLGRRDAGDAYIDTLSQRIERPDGRNLVGQRYASGFDGAPGRVVPGVSLWFNESVALDVRIRVGLAGLYPARTEIVPAA
jgi:hypothetical protein